MRSGSSQIPSGSSHLPNLEMPYLLTRSHISFSFRMPSPFQRPRCSPSCPWINEATKQPVTTEFVRVSRVETPHGWFIIRLISLLFYVHCIPFQWYSTNIISWPSPNALSNEYWYCKKHSAVVCPRLTIAHHTWPRAAKLHLSPLLHRQCPRAKWGWQVVRDATTVVKHIGSASYP